MRSADRIVMFIHDPTGTADPLLDLRMLTQLATQTPIVWPDHKGPGRTLIYEVDARDVASENGRKLS